MKKLVLLTVLSVSALFAQVKEPIEVPYIPFEIKMGKGFNTVQADCLMCHSFGYILNQGPQSKKFWHGKIVKMIDEFKAPINKKDAKIIENYLFENYGNGKLK
jgi:hypothetical protein